MLLAALAYASLTSTESSATPHDLFTTPTEARIEALLASQDEHGSSEHRSIGHPLLKHTYIEVGAISMNVDDLQGTDDDVDSYYGKVSIAIAFVHLIAGYENQSTDFEDTSTDLIRLGAGVHLPISSVLQAVADISWLYADIDSDLSNLDDTNYGYEVKAGVRWAVVSILELHGNYVRIDLDNRLASDDVADGWEAGARLHVTPMFSIGGTYTMLEDDDAVAANLRLQF